MAEAVLLAALAALALAVWMLFRVQRTLEEKHRQMLADLHDGLVRQSDRVGASIGELREAVALKLDARLDQISSRVSERLDDGFRKTNDTFVSVMQRLSTIDEAQKKIDSLTMNVVSLQELLGDKRSRGAFGEVQLEAIVRNALPETAFEFQYTFARGVRADCVLKLPEPTGLIAIDSKFPLENFERMFAEGVERISAAAFKIDLRKHIDDIASKYIIPGETSAGAILFLPAEAVFAEIHARHRDLVDYAQKKCVWLTSPTTLMAVLTTAQAVIRSVETRKQIHIIKDELHKLGADFGRFQSRMDNLAKHIEQAKNDVDDVHVSSRKISERFARIERVELEASDQPKLRAVDGAAEK